MQGKGKGKAVRPLARPKRRWEDNVKMDFKEIGTVDLDWIHLAHGRIQ